MFDVLRTCWRALPLPDAVRKRVTPVVRDVSNYVFAALVPPPAPLGQIRPGPVTVAGFTSSAFGLGMSARLARDTLRALGYEVREINLSAMIGLDDFAHAHAPAPEGQDGVLIMQLNPPEAGHGFRQLALDLVRNTYRIGYWAWELPRMPKSWIPYLRHFHEIWVLSQFMADAVCATVPDLKVPVRVMTIPVPPLDHIKPNRARFNLPADANVILTAFDLRSSFARKNPRAAIDVFRRAVKPGENAILVLKASRPEADPERYAELQAICRDDPRIRLIDEVLEPDAMMTLTASSDIMLSLHRAEGFGLVPAEAMRLGKPVIATGWSGNLDFMTPAVSRLLPYRLVPVDDPSGIYQGQEWAEADTPAAVTALRELLDNPAAAKELGEKGRQHVAALFSPEAFERNLSAAMRRFAIRRT